MSLIVVVSAECSNTSYRQLTYGGDRDLSFWDQNFNRKNKHKPHMGNNNLRIIIANFKATEFIFLLLEMKLSRHCKLP